MRKVDMIVVHCSATKEGADFRAENVRRWHLDRGFNDIGYHYVVDLDGTVEAGRNLDVAGAHAQGYNSRSIGICYIGGLDANGKPKDTRTPAQRKAIVEIIQNLLALQRYKGITQILGHRDLGANKACPCFDAIPEYKYLLDER